MSFSLTESDKERVRYHLGYLNVDPAASIALGFPAATEPGFLVERAMNRINSAYAVARVQRILAILDSIEAQMTDALIRLQAVKVDEITIRNSRDEVVEQDELEHEYRRWGRRLANQLGVPVNPLSERYGGSVVGTLRVNSGV